MGADHENRVGFGDARRNALQTRHHLAMARVSEQRHGAAAVGDEECAREGMHSQVLYMLVWIASGNKYLAAVPRNRSDTGQHFRAIENL